MSDWKNTKWIETNVNRTRTFRAGNEDPILIHVTKSGFDDEYIVIHEFGDSETYDMFILNGADINEKYGITA